MEEPEARESPVEPSDQPIEVVPTGSDPDDWLSWGLLLAVIGLLLLCTVLILVAYQNGPSS